MDIELLTQPFWGDITALVAFWMLINTAGIFLSYVAMVLSFGDRRRALTGWKDFEKKVGTVSKTRRSIIVLGDAAAIAELIRLIIHAGHLAVGAVATVTPRARNVDLLEWTILASSWFIISALLMNVQTLHHLKARYDYRAVQATGQRSTWLQALRLAIKEFGQEMVRRSISR